MNKNMPFITKGKTNWKFLLIAVILAAIVAGGALSWQNWEIAKLDKLENNVPKLKSPEVKVSSFNDCAKAGYPIFQTYPAQCKTPDGKTFIESPEVTEVTVETINKNPQLYDNSKVKLEGYIIKNVGAFFGPTYHLQTPVDVKDFSTNTKITLFSEINLENFISYTFDGKTYAPLNPRVVTIGGTIEYLGQVTDYSSHHLLVESIVLPNQELLNQVCDPKTTNCTTDIRAMCNPETREFWKGPSSCGCGLDADSLSQKGWIDCPEKL